MEALKKVKDSEDKEAIKKAADDLAQTAQKVGAAMYQSQQQQPPQGGPAAGGAEPEKKDEKKDDKKKTVEGEFEEVK